MSKQSNLPAAFYHLTKPGIIRGNLITTLAGYLMASQLHIKLGALLGVLTGTALVIACGCVINNYIDRGIDKKMKRTHKRALVTGVISTKQAFVFAGLLGVTGFTILVLLTNLLTVVAGATGLFFYVVMYSIFKRRSSLGTLVGSVSGSMPPVAGYVAFTSRLDGGALLLFLILVAWQMTHFFAIALFRQDEYEAAGLPVLPAMKGSYATKLQMFIYCVLFIFCVIALKIFGYANYSFVVVTVLLGLWWLRSCFQGFKAPNDVIWAKAIFRQSLVIISTLSIMLSLSRVLP